MRHHSHTARSIRPRRPRQPPYATTSMAVSERSCKFAEHSWSLRGIVPLARPFSWRHAHPRQKFSAFQDLVHCQETQIPCRCIFPNNFLNTRAARIATMPTINTIKGAHTSNVTAVGILIGATIKKIMLPVRESHKTVAVGIIRRSFGFVRCLHRRIVPRRQC